MSVRDQCGPHCGITASAGVTREGHCDCRICHAGELLDGPDVIIVLAEEGGERVLPDYLPKGTPMCARWYERAGDYRPWQAGSHPPSPPPGQPMTSEQEDLLRKLAGGTS